MYPSGPLWAQHLSFCANLTESKPRALALAAKQLQGPTLLLNR